MKIMKKLIIVLIMFIVGESINAQTSDPDLNKTLYYMNKNHIIYPGSRVIGPIQIWNTSRTPEEYRRRIRLWALYGK